MPSQKAGRLVVLTAVPIIVCSAVFVLYAGVSGSLPSIFGFEKGYVMIVGLQLIAAIEMLLMGSNYRLLSYGFD
ncbi:hypothetical protein [Halogranum rubrum]|uniref:hypothetical protein n=1 Tax=Halogranum rubrum TaxID=553466 RepID=UPI001160563A|nr:hypothetical protein [Halogranum rubrum]